MPVVRFDHDSQSNQGHDVAEEGLHMDVYRGSEKWAIEDVFPPTTPSVALTLAEEHLSLHAERYVERYERWHGNEGETE